eukprot:710127-Pleurochrysis_carterae.AAC.3
MRNVCARESGHACTAAAAPALSWAVRKQLRWVQRIGAESSDLMHLSSHISETVIIIKRLALRVESLHLFKFESTRNQSEGSLVQMSRFDPVSTYLSARQRLLFGASCERYATRRERFKATAAAAAAAADALGWT